MGRNEIAPDAGRLHPRHWIFLALILAAGACLRFSCLNQQSMWLDEFWSVEIATGRGPVMYTLPFDRVIDPPQLYALDSDHPWWSVWTGMDGVAHPPLYHILLRGWIDLFGDSPAATRSLSALFSLLTIPTFFYACRLRFSPAISLWATAVMAAAAPQIQFAHDARSYSLLILLGVICLAAVTHIEKRGATLGAVAALTLAALAMPLTHYLCVGGLVGLAIYTLIRLRGRDRLVAASALAAAAIIFVFAWGPWMLRQRALLGPNTDWLTERGPMHLPNTLWRLALAPGFAFFDHRGTFVGLAALAVACVVPLLRWRKSDLLLWWLWGGGTIAFVLALDVSRDLVLLKYLRYTILAAPTLYVALAAGYAGLGRFWPHAVPAAVILLTLLVPNGGPPGREIAKDDWRGFSQAIVAHADKNDLLAFYGNDEKGPGGTWYAGFNYYVRDSHRPILILGDNSRLADAGLLSRYPAVWLIGPEKEGPPRIAGWTAWEIYRSAAGRLFRLEATPMPETQPR